MNHFVFKLDKFNSLSLNPQESVDDYEFLRRKVVSKNEESVHLVISEKKVSATFMNNKMSCSGLEENR